MILAIGLSACYRSPEAYVGSPLTAPADDRLVLADASSPGSVAPAIQPTEKIAVYQKADSDGQTPVPYAAGLTLREAIGRALRFSPSIQAASIEIDARRAEALQAGLRPNPQLDGDVQNVGQDVQESTLELSQVILLGGKRLKRIQAAELDVGVAAWDYEAARLRVASSTAEAFVDVLAGQERIKILDELHDVAGKLSSAVAERVKAGIVSPVELKRTEIEVVRAESQLKEEKTTLSVAKRRLANNWGASNSDFGSAAGDLATTNHIPSAEQLGFYLASNPDVARWTAEMTRREAVLNLARAQRIPDLTIGAGARNIKDADETGAVVSLSIPLPVFDRNQGNIEAAQTRVFKGRRESLAARIDVNAVFLDAYGRLLAASERLKALEGEILPKAQEVYDATVSGYSDGKFDFLSVLDAQRTLFSTRLDIVNARAEFHKAKVQIEALIGRGLYDL
jgi:cobalt-zinc-cadmium efflux system outer membrane protein